MSMSGLLLVPAVATLAPAEQLREAINLFPQPPVSSDYADPYSPALLRDETGALAGLIGVLAKTTNSMRWGTLVAHHAMRTRSELRANGWPLVDRDAVNPVRDHLERAVAQLSRASAELAEADRYARLLVDHLHPVDRAAE